MRNTTKYIFYLYTYIYINFENLECCVCQKAIAIKITQRQLGNNLFSNTIQTIYIGMPLQLYTSHSSHIFFQNFSVSFFLFMRRCLFKASCHHLPLMPHFTPGRILRSCALLTLRVKTCEQDFVMN